MPQDTKQLRLIPGGLFPILWAGCRLFEPDGGILPSKIKRIFDRAPKDVPIGFERKLKLPDEEK